MAHSSNIYEIIKSTLDTELDELRSINTQLRSADRDRVNAANKIFPIKCQSCERIYTDYFYLEAHAKKVLASTPDNSTRTQWQCSCQETMEIPESSRRIESALGAKRRELFDKSVDKLGHSVNLPKTRLYQMVRMVFRDQIDEHL